MIFGMLWWNNNIDTIQQAKELIQQKNIQYPCTFFSIRLIVFDHFKRDYFYARILTSQKENKKKYKQVIKNNLHLNELKKMFSFCNYACQNKWMILIVTK